MKSNRIFQLTCLLLLIGITVLYVPGSMAKYVDNKSYQFEVKSKLKENHLYEYYSYSKTAQPNGHQTITLDYKGYYAILVKGGNGGDGYRHGNGSR